MKWPQAGSRANKLAAGVDGAPFAGSLDSDTAALVSLAARLRDIEPPVISAEYSADLRLSLLQAAPDLIGSADAIISDVPRAPRRLRARTVRLSAATTAVLLATGTGVGYASTSALPGGPLYPVKRTIEGVQLAVARSNIDKGYEHLTQASTRLTEVVGLSEGDQSPYTETLIEDTLADFSVSAQAGADLFFEAYDGDDQPDSMRTLHAFNVGYVETLDDLGADAPPAVWDEVVSAAMSVHSIDTKTVSTCTDCADPVLDIPESLVTLAPEIVESGVPEIVTPTPETVGSPSTILPVTTVPGSIPAEVTTPATQGGPTVAPPGVTAPAPTDVPPSVSGTAPAPTTEVPPTTEPLQTTSPPTTEAPTTPDPAQTPDPSQTPDPPQTPDASQTPDPSGTPDPPTTSDESVIPDSSSPLISDSLSTSSAPTTTVPQPSTDSAAESQAPASTITTTLPSGLMSDSLPRPLETPAAAPLK